MCAPHQQTHSHGFLRCHAAVMVKVATTENPSVLVVMGAQAAARQRFHDALYILRRALLRDPSHARHGFAASCMCCVLSCWLLLLRAAAAAWLVLLCSCADKACSCITCRAHYSIGQVYSLMGRWTDAAAAFERSAELNAGNDNAQVTTCFLCQSFPAGMACTCTAS